MAVIAPRPDPRPFDFAQGERGGDIAPTPLPFVLSAVEALPQAYGEL